MTICTCKWCNLKSALSLSPQSAAALDKIRTTPLLPTYTALLGLQLNR